MVPAGEDHSLTLRVAAIQKCNSRRETIIVKFRVVLPLVLGLLLSIPAFAQKQYKLADTVKLGGDGGWDYLTFDKDGQRLFITRGTHVMVVDAKTLKQTADIPDQSGIHGVALAPEMNKGFISNGGDDSVAVFDLKTLKVTDKVKVGGRPDAILYEPFSKHVFTFNAKSQDSTVVDAASNKVLATIPLGGKPEFPASDGKGKLFVNIEDKNEIAAVDVKTNTVTAHWPLTGCEEPSALAFDVEHGRLFSGCGNKAMAVTNAGDGKRITLVPIGAGVDAGAFNPGTQEVFMSCGEGTLAVIHQDSPDKYSVRQTVPTVRGARTMALDPSTNAVYLVTAQFGEKGPNDRRPPMIPGTFELLVVKPQ
jgi:YVTN family beta-propeller protein